MSIGVKSVIQDWGCRLSSVEIVESSAATSFILIIAGIGAILEGMNSYRYRGFPKVGTLFICTGGLTVTLALNRLFRFSDAYCSQIL